MLAMPDTALQIYTKQATDLVPNNRCAHCLDSDYFAAGKFSPSDNPMMQLHYVTLLPRRQFLD
jgi:hypothetical protein